MANYFCVHLSLPLRDVDLPVEPAAVEDPGAPNPGGSVRPVGMEVGDPLLGPVQPNLVALVILVPRPVVLAAGQQGVGLGRPRMDVCDLLARRLRLTAGV